MSFKKTAFLYSEHIKFTKSISWKIYLLHACVYVFRLTLNTQMCPHCQIRNCFTSFKLLTIRDEIVISVTPLLFSIIYIIISWNSLQSQSHVPCFFNCSERIKLTSEELSVGNKSLQHLSGGLQKWFVIQ